MPIYANVIMLYKVMTSRKCKDDLSRNGLRLSVSNNIDILREKLMKEMMARRKESEKAAAEVSDTGSNPCIQVELQYSRRPS